MSPACLPGVDRKDGLALCLETLAPLVMGLCLFMERPRQRLQKLLSEQRRTVVQAPGLRAPPARVQSVLLGPP